MSQDDLRVAIQAGLAAGCGPIITWLMNQLIQWRAEDNKPISPKTRRRVALLMCVVVPTALYCLAWGLGWNAYRLGENLAYITTAFLSSQVVHGETSLPSGAQERLIEAGLADPPKP